MELQSHPRQRDSSATIEEEGHRLAPIVRLALRSGEGLPPVVRWVRRTFAAMADGRDVPPEQYTPAIAQLLARRLRGLEPGAAHAG